MGMELIFRKKRQRRTKRQNGRQMNGAETAKLKQKEFDRWWRLIEGTTKRLQGLNVVHVTDREGDSYELLAKLTTGNQYVVRWCKDRCAKFSDEAEAAWEHVSELLARAKSTKLVREVHVGARRAKRAPSAARARPERDSRNARVRFSCCKLDFKRPAYLSKATYPAAISVNAVHVYEPSPPEGEEPIEWVLLTNLPIRNISEVERVIDIYRQRWLIEEYFKAIKSGCAYRQRNLTNTHSILNTLAMFLPIAYKVLLLRQTVHVAYFPAHRALTPVELDVLKAKAKRVGRPLGRDPTAQEALLIIARLGGHRKSSGPPGWITLMKGMEKFLNLVDGWQLAHETN
jgi:hypothetical protein